MKKKPQPNRIRKPLNITLSPEAREWIKNNPSNASRLIESLINGVRNNIEPNYVLISQKEAVSSGLGGIRTPDLRRVKATS